MVPFRSGNELSRAMSWVGPHAPPTIGCPSGKNRVMLAPLDALLPGTTGAVKPAFLSALAAGSGAHNAALPAHTEAKVQDGVNSRSIWVLPPSRSTLAVCPRCKSCVHCVPAQTLAWPSCSETSVWFGRTWISRMVPRTPIEANGVSIL